jgi:hypothetical protein
LRGVSDVLLLVLNVEALAIPAAWEHQLQTDTINTIGIKISLVWHEVAIKGTLRSLSIVEAIETHCSLLKESLGIVRGLVPERLLDVGDWVAEVAVVGIASNHVEVCRESRQASAASVGVQKVVP